MKIFADRIKELRIAKELTQKELAESLKISPSGYAGYEQNYREPDLETLKRICIYFNVTSDELLGLDEPEAREQSGKQITNSFNNLTGNNKITIK